MTGEVELGPGEDGLVLGLDVGLALGEVDGLLLGELDTPGPGDALCPEDAPGEGLHPQTAFKIFCSTSVQGNSAHGMQATVHEQFSARSPGPTASSLQGKTGRHYATMALWQACPEEDCSCV